jgi:uncharacterized membrane protein
MKFIAYFFAAVAVALVVVGLVFAFGTTSAVAAAGHGMSATPNLSGVASVLVNLAVVAVITAIVAPIKQRLERKRQASAPARRQHAQTTAAPSV